MRSTSIKHTALLQPPMRRVLAIDPGHRAQKLLLLESDFGHLRLVRHEMIDLQAEGLVSENETKAHLQQRLDEWGRPALSAVLPQHVTTSQILDLPEGPEREVEQQIEAETLKLGGVSQSRIVHDFVRLKTPSKTHEQFWVTLCQEADIRERLGRLGIEHEDICDITTSANALIAAFRWVSPQTSEAILVHIGAETTILVILVAGQAAFASSYQMGGDFFTRSLARALGCAEERAEQIKKEQNVLSGEHAHPDFISAVEGWVTELKGQLNDWFELNPALAGKVADFKLIRSGVAFEQPGLADFLKREAALDFQPWPVASQAGRIEPPRGFEIAFGAALQALGYCEQPVSLLPAELRQTWSKRLFRQRIEFASSVLLVVCALMLAMGTWHKIRLVHRKADLLDKVRAGREAVEANELLSTELAGQYDLLRPVFAAQQNSTDTLRSLALLQQSRSNRSFWYVLVADQQSYFSFPPPQLSTNKITMRTNAAPGGIGPPSVVSMDRVDPLAAMTNNSPAKPGLIAEISIPEDAETSRKALSSLVTELVASRVFEKVDLLSEDLRRSGADPKVVVPDRHYSLRLDFSTDFVEPAQYQHSGAASRGSPRSRSNPAEPFLHNLPLPGP